MTRMVLIRHGETDWNVEGRYQGQEDPPLNARGLAQAEAAAVRLEGRGLDVIYSSPLLRAVQTAQLIAGRLRIPLHTEPRLMEIHQGDWQRRLRAEIEALYPDLFRRWEAEPWEVCPPHGENMNQVQRRVYGALDEILAAHAGQCIGIVTHRIPFALLKVRFQGLAATAIRTLNLPNTHFEEILVHDDGLKETADGS